jgi:hypothetical protein
MPTAWIKRNDAGEPILSVSTNEDNEVVRAQKLQGSSQDHSFILQQAERLLHDFGGWRFTHPPYWEHIDEGYRGSVSLVPDAKEDLERSLMRRDALARVRVGAVPEAAVLNEYDEVVDTRPLVGITDDELRDLADQRLRESGWLRVEPWQYRSLLRHVNEKPWVTALCRSTRHDITMELRWAVRQTPSLVGPDGGWVMSVRVDGEVAWMHPFVPGFAGLDCWPRDGYVLAEKLQGAIPYLDGIICLEGAAMTPRDEV